MYTFPFILPVTYTVKLKWAAEMPEIFNFQIIYKSVANMGFKFPLISISWSRESKITFRILFHKWSSITVYVFRHLLAFRSAWSTANGGWSTEKECYAHYLLFIFYICATHQFTKIYVFKIIFLGWQLQFICIFIYYIILCLSNLN